MGRGDVAVIGGGIVGLATALGAAETGANVTLYDPLVGGGATHAAAGMLSPGSEFLGGFQPDYENARRALADWQDFSQNLNVTVHRCSTELVGWSHGDRQDIARYLAAASASGVETCDAVGDGFVLSPRVTVSASIANEAFVDVDSVVVALRQKLDALGVTFVEQRVTDVSDRSEQPKVRTGTTSSSYDQVIIATGAANPPVMDMTDSMVHAVRGVTVRIGMPPGRPTMLRGFVDGKSVYLVRRPNGVTVIGATADLRTDAVVQTRDVQELLDLASRIVPEVHDAEFIDARAGLRPSSVDGLSFFTALTPKVAVTSGYFRHGVLMAPLAARRAKEFVSANPDL